MSDPNTNVFVQLGLFFGLPILLVGGAMVGSKLRADVRRRVETVFLMPLFVLLAALGAGYAIWVRNWIEIAFFLVVLAVAVERLVKRLREGRRAPLTP